MSTAPEGRCTYRTTDPRMNMSFVEHCCTLAMAPNKPLLSLSPRFLLQISAKWRTYQVRPPDLVHCLCVVELDVQVLVHALQRPANLDFVLEFDGDLVLDERLEETGELLMRVLLSEGEGRRRSAIELVLEGLEGDLRT